VRIVALIPAYNPTDQLVDYVRSLSNADFAAVIVVNDGSNEQCDHIFRELSCNDKVIVLHHAINMGKGAALKTGFNYVYCFFRECVGVVTVDADGQHLTEDAINVAEALHGAPESLTMGVRRFSSDVPIRSRIGNNITNRLFDCLIGKKLTDTQTGLRGIPMDFLPSILKIGANGYEFELDMLLACKYSGRRINEVPISTIYIDNNSGSHFNPVIDSMKIYYVLFRYLITSLITAMIDLIVFVLVIKVIGSIGMAQAMGRLIGLVFNYAAVSKLVFYSEQEHKTTLPKYLILVTVSGLISYFSINEISANLGINIILAKMVAESVIFLANFAIQRDFIFTRSVTKKRTDWDKYYDKPFRTAAFTRRITENRLIGKIIRYATSPNVKPAIGELGGANSCFYAGINARIAPREYHIIDNNSLGLEKFRKKFGNNSKLCIYEKDVLKLDMSLDLDIVFSVGLIEHFTPDDTRKAVLSHLQLTKPGGIVIMSFPTPTLLYRISRFLLEISNLWIFHDERPLSRKEIFAVLQDNGEIIDCEIIWPIFLTQMIVVVRNSKIKQIYSAAGQQNGLTDELRQVDK